MTCPTCGSEIPQPVHGNRKYCSYDCQRRKHKYLVIKWSGLTCAACGGPFDKLRRGPKPKYCSLDCKNRSDNPKKRLARKGISSDRHDDLMRLQDGRCAVCRRLFEATPHIDHDHSCCSGQSSCGKCVRGLLCETCNRGLGFFGDDVTVLASAIEYLTR